MPQTESQLQYVPQPDDTSSTGGSATLGDPGIRVEVPQDLLERVRAYVEAQGHHCRGDGLDAHYPAVSNPMFAYIRHLGGAYSAGGVAPADVLTWVAATAWLEGHRAAVSAASALSVDLAASSTGGEAAEPQKAGTPG